MNKKIIAVNCGPRKGFNTDKLIEEAINGAKSKGYEVEKFDLYKLEHRAERIERALEGKV